MSKYIAYFYMSINTNPGKTFNQIVNVSSNITIIQDLPGLKQFIEVFYEKNSITATDFQTFNDFVHKILSIPNVTRFYDTVTGYYKKLYPSPRIFHNYDNNYIIYLLISVLGMIVDYLNIVERSELFHNVEIISYIKNSNMPRYIYRNRLIVDMNDIKKVFERYIHRNSNKVITVIHPGHSISNIDISLIIVEDGGV